MSPQKRAAALAQRVKASGIVLRAGLVSIVLSLGTGAEKAIVWPEELVPDKPRFLTPPRSQRP